ncbi:MAG: sialate O-acetylesterase [Armatimonadetes bacterium]|nr:sialate O-acetylesterase [Armatimonadota bacterium]
MKIIRSLLVFAGLALAIAGHSIIRVASIYSNNMVLQQNTFAAIWGTGTPSSGFRISTGWGVRANVKVGTDGKWSVRLRTPRPGGPYTISIAGENNITFSNVLVGEVWLASGQSNMEFPMGGGADSPVVGAAEALASANIPSLRLFKVAPDGTGSWVQSSPSAVSSFSAVGFFFGRKMVQNLRVPIGVIQATGGGTAIERWMSPAAIASMPDAAAERDDVKLNNNITYSDYYLAEILPLLPFSLKGVIWYQGEANCWNSEKYFTRFSKFVDDWREGFKRADLPIYTVQLSPYAPWDGRGVEVRAAQARAACSLSRVGIVPTLDLSTDLNNIHPGRKLEVGERLAGWALAKTYGGGAVFSGPIPKSQVLSTGRVVLSFDFGIGGMRVEPSGNFELVDQLGQTYPADVSIQGTQLVLSNPNVGFPKGVRYACSDLSVASLFNGVGLPAPAFRTDY